MATKTAGERQRNWHRDVRRSPGRFGVPTRTQARRDLLVIGLALAVGGVAITLLRQGWAKAVWWPWLPLVLAIFVAASALRHLDPWRCRAAAAR